MGSAASQENERDASGPSALEQTGGGVLWNPSSRDELGLTECLDTKANGNFEFVNHGTTTALRLQMKHRYDHAWHSASVLVPPHAQSPSRVTVNFFINELQPNGWYCNLYLESASGRIAAIECKFDVDSLRAYDVDGPPPGHPELQPNARHQVSFTERTRIRGGQWEEFELRMDWPAQTLEFLVSQREISKIKFNRDTGPWKKLRAFVFMGYAKGGTSHWADLKLSTLSDTVLSEAERLLADCKRLGTDLISSQTLADEIRAGEFKPPKEHPRTAELLNLVRVADSQIAHQQISPQLVESVGLLLDRLNEVCAAYLAATEDPTVRDALRARVGPMMARYARGYEWAFKDLIQWDDQEGLDAYMEFAMATQAGIEMRFCDHPSQSTNSLLQVSIAAAPMQPRVTDLCKAIADRFRGTHVGGASVKSLFRAGEKVAFRRDLDPSHLVDVARGGVEFDSMDSIQSALRWLVDGAGATDEPHQAVTVLRMKNRFGAASAGGWRDALVNFHFNDNPERVVCEVQLMHSRLFTIRKFMGAHKDYSIYRAATELLEYHES